MTISRHLAAPRARVYRALLDPADIARWRYPDGMSCEVHTFEAREGGAFRVSLTYVEPGGVGKSSAHTDTYAGTFTRLVADTLVVERLAFETTDPAMAGEMTITTTLADAHDGGTVLTAEHVGLPPGVSPADNELGWKLALDRLAALVER